jgi:hypothetical protein
MEKRDLKKELKHLYKPSPKRPVIIDVPEMNFLMIDGEGDPNTSQMFQDAIATLFPLSYNLKFKVKKKQEIDYGVMPLEGLWWGTPKGLTKFTSDDRDKWFWTLMMMQPEMISEEMVNTAIEEVQKKKNPPMIENVRFENFNEGSVVQQMHIGPFSDEWKTVEPMHKWVEEQGYKLKEKHHEIYLSDMRRTAPEKLKTVLRHPIQKLQ